MANKQGILYAWKDGSVKLIASLVIACLVWSVMGCRKNSDEQSEGQSGSDTLKITNLINGQLGDKSFYDSSANGMNLIAEKYGTAVETRTVEMTYNETNWEPTLLDVLDQDWDIVIVGTWQMQEMLEELAPLHPDKRFIIYDTAVDYSKGNLDNVYSILYAQNEASFLAGALAALVTESDMPLANPEALIGFLGGVDSAIINDFLVGYIQGARTVNPQTRVAISYIGSYEDSAKGKEMALAQYALGVDIGYNVAAQAGLGQLDAAREVNRYAIGVDSDQAALFADSDPEKSERIVTSVLKRVDLSLLRAIDNDIQGTPLYGQAETLGFAEGAVGLARNDIYRGLLPSSIQETLDKLETDIREGRITVDSAFGMEQAELNTLRNSVKP